MSMQQHPEARFDGWEGPFYPSMIRTHLAPVLSVEHTARNFERAAGRLSGFARILEGSSADGYEWFWLLRFNLEMGALMVAFPLANDVSRTDDTYLDRSPAIYVQGTVGEDEVARILLGLTEALA